MMRRFLIATMAGALLCAAPAFADDGWQLTVGSQTVLGTRLDAHTFRQCNGMPMDIPRDARVERTSKTCPHSASAFVPYSGHARLNARHHVRKHHKTKRAHHPGY